MTCYERGHNDNIKFMRAIKSYMRYLNSYNLSEQYLDSFNFVSGKLHRKYRSFPADSTLWSTSRREIDIVRQREVRKKGVREKYGKYGQIGYEVKMTKFDLV